MEMTQSFEVTAHREGRWWVFEIPALEDGGQARSLAEAEFEARDIASMNLDVDIDSIAVNVTVEGLDDARAAWRAAEAAELEARAAQARAAQQKRAVVAGLTGERGLSAADASKMLGISPQRIYQIAGPKRTRALL